ncbi:MAG TPA: PAS domain S-box protein [Chloroflexota bacterium]|nr:PAS domain S-box protein [Chloroflexota bacterium]
MNSQPIKLVASSVPRDEASRATPANEGRRRSRAQSLAATLSNSHLWLTLAMVAAGAILHYVDPSLVASEAGPLDLSQRSMHRILFIVPVAYAGFIFGPWPGYATLLAVVAIMLPRAFFMADSPVDELMEVASIAVVSSLILLWFSGQRRERARRHEILSRLELARQELASQVELIKKSEKRLAAINDICCVVGQSLELSPLLDRVMGRVVDNLGVDAALVFLKSGAGSQLELVAHKGVCQETARAVATLPVGRGLNGTVAATGEPIALEDAATRADFSLPAGTQERLRAFLIVPLRSKGATIGTLCAAQVAPRAFSPDDQELLGAIGSQVGMAIENARLYQDALTSEEKFRDLFENATEAIFVQNLEGGIVTANQACRTLTGYPTEELVGMEVGDLFPGESIQSLEKVQSGLLQGSLRSDPFDIQLVRQDGSLAVLSMTTRLVRQEGRPAGFQHIAIDVTEQRRMRDTMNFYLRQILTAQEEERKRIARELHDETAQSLLLILQRIDGISQDGWEGMSRAQESEMEELRDVLLKTLGDLRRLTHDLRPQILDDLGLVPAVEWLAEEVERQAGIQTSIEVSGEARSLSPEAQLLLFRIAQEALSNVRRHSGASHARVCLHFSESRVRLTVEDDGHGFELPESMGDLAATGKLGLLGMSERARLMGGSLTIHSKPGEGTRVIADLSA